MFNVKIDPKDIPDLPKSKEPGILFYELVVKDSFAKPILRVPFLDEVIHLQLWRHDSEMPDANLDRSMSGTVARYDSLPLNFHFYKIMGGDGEPTIAFKRHVTSAVQDVSSFTLSTEKDVRFTNVAPMSPLKDVPLYERRGGRRWLTQREFYGTTAVTSSNPIHRDNLERAIHGFLQRYKSKTFDSVLAMLIEYGIVMKMGRVKYKNDTEFANSGVRGDSGDALVELTTQGDCEDFGHFYMRTIRMLTNIFPFILTDTESDLYKKCLTVRDQYVAFNYICRVLVNGNQEFHSTMLIVPNKTHVDTPVLSYEVTDPTKSYALPDKEFDKWHSESYFMLDANFIHRLNRSTDPHKSPPVNLINISNLLLYNY